MSEPQGQAGALEFGPDGEPLLHPEEKVGLTEVHRHEPVRCWSCGRSVEPADPASVALSVDGELAVAELAHLDCAPPRADLVGLVALALADPEGVAYAQALHPEAGAVLVWQRKLDIRLRGSLGGERRPYVDAHQRSGFHPMRRDKPVRWLDHWRLSPDGADLILGPAGEPVDRFAGAEEAAPAAWRAAVEASGHCLLIVGGGLAAGSGQVQALQEALRAGEALMGLAAFAPC